MEPRRFRPHLDALEARHTPSATPAEVMFAARFADAAAGVLEQLSDRLAGPLRTETLDQIKDFMPKVAFAEAWAAGVLTEFHATLAAQLAADPSSAVSLGPLAARVAGAEGQARAGAARADVAAIALGAPSLQQQYAALNPAADTGSSTTDDSSTSDGSTSGTDTGADKGTSGDTATPPPAPLSTTDDSGMSDTIPPLDDPHWVTMPDGLRVWTVVPGEGTPVQATSNITVFYSGWLKSDGTRFETNRPSSPSTFDLTGLIKGWQEGLPGLKPGGLVRLDIPSALAYGTTGSPPKIPGNADLVFEIKVLSVNS
jgi:hypothetical protein